MPGPAGYNLKRLEQLRNSVAYEASRGKHDQGTWGRFVGKVKEKFDWPDNGTFAAVSCPTSACAAGYTTLAAGAKMLIEFNERTGRADSTANFVLTKDGEVRGISNYAAELLGIDVDESQILFSGSPTSRETLANIDQLICAAKHGRTWIEQRRMDRDIKVEV